MKLFACFMAFMGVHNLVFAGINGVKYLHDFRLVDLGMCFACIVTATLALATVCDVIGAIKRKKQSTP